ncbi:hypothetical protein [Streptomyces chiangmaiensis]|uniref:Uncharacterized protein n=1 Tax=Streptomyces chiangmaiensis TaxID=766497 RepID=A0ABU7FW45_9ACTN|nr:hypothetical protein [Streptomyces chiangmaiensis]MED7828336.1 hypothetical protein [Streptomyces chiangmaiensis]
MTGLVDDYSWIAWATAPPYDALSASFHCFGHLMTPAVHTLSL